MSKESKLALIQALEEKKRRQRSQKDRYVPHVGQMRVHKSSADERYLFGANGSGKSTILVNEMAWAMKGYNPILGTHTPVPAKGYLVVDDPTKIDDVILCEYRKWHELPEEWCHKAGKAHISKITYPNGSTLNIITHEVNLLKVEGVEITHLFEDEPPPRAIHIGLTRGGRIKGKPLKIIMAGTPLYQPWLRLEIFESWTEGKLPHVECFFAETQENPHLAEGYIERFGALLTEEEKKTRFRGHFFDLSGQALAHLWSESAHVLHDSAWNEADWPCVIAIDPHPSKAHVAVLLGCDPEGRYQVLEEYARKCVARVFITDIIEKGWFNKVVVDVVYDSLGSADTTSGEGSRPFGDVVSEVMTAKGLGRARATRYEDKDDESWLDRIMSVLAIPQEDDSFGQRIPRLRVRSHCKGAIRDIKQVQWLRDRKNNVNQRKLDISNKDFLACIKYALACNLTPNKHKARSYHVSRNVYGFSPRRLRPRPAVVGSDD